MRSMVVLFLLVVFTACGTPVYKADSGVEQTILLIAKQPDLKRMYTLRYLREDEKKIYFSDIKMIYHMDDKLSHFEEVEYWLLKIRFKKAELDLMRAIK
jgi:hypothetical protein